MTAHSLESLVVQAMEPAVGGRESLRRVDLGERTAACEKHGEFVQSGTRFFGRHEVWTRCPKCEAQRVLDEEKQLAEANAKRQRDALEAMTKRAAIPRRFVGRTFDNFTATTEQQQKALGVVRSYADGFEKRFQAGHGLVLSGLPGTGKSHLASAILQAIMPAHVGLYVTLMGMIRMVRNTWRRGADQSEGEVLDLLASVDLLVIDEVGVQYGTDGEQTVLFEVLDQRYQDQVPTILLTNQDKDGFKGYIGERSFDRLTETSRWVAFDWQSHRTHVRKGQP